MIKFRPLALGVCTLAWVARSCGAFVNHVSSPDAVVFDMYLNGILPLAMKQPRPRVIVLPLRFRVADDNYQISQHNCVLLSELFFRPPQYCKHNAK